MDFSLFSMAASFSLALWLRLLLSLPFHVLRAIVQFLGTRLNSNFRKIISSNHYLDPDGRLLVAHNLLISIKIRGIVNVKKFRDAFEAECIQKRNPKTKRLQFPEMQEEIKIWCGYPFWAKRQNKEFDIEDHIVGEDQMSIMDEEAGKLFEQNVLRREFQRNEGSPWKMYLLLETGQKSGTNTRLLFSFHHSLGDGQCMYGLLMRLATNATDANVQPPGGAHASSSPSWMTSLLRMLPPRNPLLAPMHLIQNFIKCAVPPPFYLNPDQMTKNHRVFAKSLTIPKNTLSMISKKNDVPFTAVLLSAVTGALRKYTQGKTSAIPNFIMCPMPIPLGKNREKELTNAIQSVEFTLPLGKENVKDRLLECKKTFVDAKYSAFPLLVRISLFVENGYPLAMKPGPGQLPPIVLSSFPGPKVPISILENSHEIIEMDFSWNGSNYMSVIVTTLTYADGIRIVLSVDPAAFVFENDEGISKVMDDIHTEINLMKSL